MKVAIFGGSGFMGYDFYRVLADTDGITPIVYCSSAIGLSNLARHELDLRFVPTSKLAEEKLDADVDLVVNFAHPFVKRYDMSTEEQIDAYVQFFAANRRANNKLQLIHISTMSVYEPFAQGVEFEEEAKLQPDPSDAYATSKLLFDRKLQELPNATEWQLFLRPTIVYGPFCRPWTDGPLGAFDKSDVGFTSMEGKIQPIFGRDISLFLRDRLTDFRPGTFNMGGPQTVTWMEFFRFYQSIVNKGQLAVELDEEGEPVQANPSAFSYYGKNIKQMVKDAALSRSFRNMLKPTADRTPRWLQLKVHWLLRTPEVVGSPPEPIVSDREVSEAFCRPFFGEDRLVNMNRFESTFPGVKLTPLEGTREVLSQYYRYRFTDEAFV